VACHANIRVVVFTDQSPIVLERMGFAMSTNELAEATAAVGLSECAGISPMWSTVERSGVKCGIKTRFLLKKGRSNIGITRSAPGRTANAQLVVKRV